MSQVGGAVAVLTSSIQMVVVGQGGGQETHKVDRVTFTLHTHTRRVGRVCEVQVM